MSEAFYNAKNLTVSNGFVRNPDRYYLEEYFDHLPAVNGVKYSSIVARGTVHTNSTDEAALESVTIPANSLSAGDVIHIVGMAQVISSNSTDTSTIRLRLGATSAIAATEIAVSTALDVADNDDVYIDMYVTLRTLGSSGTMVGHGQIRTDGAGAVLLNIILSSTAIHTTVDNYIGFTNDWSAAHTDNQIASDSFIVEILNTNNENKNFEILGTNASKDDVTFSSTEAGIVLTTDGADNDQIIVLPHTDADQTAWTGITWGTENQVEWQCAIRTGASIANVGIWAGLRSATGASQVGATAAAYTADNNQAMFLFATDNDLGTITTHANLHFVYSIAGTDYVTDLGIAVAASTTYKLRIVVDSNRQVSAYVNGVQYGLTSTATTPSTESTSTTLSTALTNDIDLIPYVGVQALAVAGKTLTLCYEKISRVLFE
jgi:hypothetical protein